MEQQYVSTPHAGRIIVTGGARLADEVPYTEGLMDRLSVSEILHELQCDPRRSGDPICARRATETIVLGLERRKEKMRSI